MIEYCTPFLSDEHSDGAGIHSHILHFWMPVLGCTLLEAVSHFLGLSTQAQAF
jgi:hypothetical protein